MAGTCCCGNCLGCCLPVEYHALYPNGRAVNIPFCISAPACLELNGLCSIFAGPATASPRFGPCGICLGYSQEVYPLAAYKWVEPPPGPGACQQTPCSVNLCLSLICLEETAATPGIEECCSRLRLVVGCSELMSDGIVQAGTGPCISFKRVAPSACVCSTTGGRPAVTFPLSLNFLCTDLFVGGACDGKIKCCQNLTSCSLAGAEVII